MNHSQRQRFNSLYEQHLNTLTPQGKRPTNLEEYFNSRIQTHYWSTVKIDQNGLQFFYRYTLNKQWEWLNIVKPPQT